MLELLRAMCPTCGARSTHTPLSLRFTPNVVSATCSNLPVRDHDHRDLLLTLGLFVAGFGTAAMLRSYVEQQAASKLEKITDGGVTDFFQPIEDPEESDTSLTERPFRDTTGVYVALYDDSGSFVRDKWDPSDPRTPQIPAILTESERSATPGESVVIRLKDQDQHETFRGVITLLPVDDYGTLLPFIIAISTTEDEELLAFYLVI